MRRKIETTVIVLCSVLLGAGKVYGQKSFGNPLGSGEVVAPEIDFRGLGSVGIGTVLVAVAYGAEKVYRKFVGRKNS